MERVTMEGGREIGREGGMERVTMEGGREIGRELRREIGSE